MEAMIDLGIELRVKASSDNKYPKNPLIKIKGMPATGQAGGKVEITTSSDAVKLYIPDRPDTGDMDYTYNYTSANLIAVQAICDGTARDVLLSLPDGEAVEYSGQCQTWINQVGVGGSPIECTLHTVPSTVPAYLTSEQASAKIATT